MSYRDLVLKSIRDLPTLPTSTNELLKLLQAEEMDADAICKAITFDPVLSGLVLGIANSALLGGRVEIASIRAAVLRLGHNRLLATVLGAAVGPRMRESGMTCYDAWPGSLWEQSVALAVAAEEVAIQAAIVNPADAFTIGLLADVGKLGMAPVAGEHAEELVQHTLKDQVGFDRAERDILDIDHSEAGALMLESWGLPQSIVVPVHWHHRPCDCPSEYQSLADIVHVAQHLCRQLGGPQGFDEGHMEVQPESLERLYLNDAEVELALFSIENKLGEVMRAFGVRRAAA
ncbi:MAG: HDOD domain-containing protein [Planctomycetota bacterium]|nr:HDOD domain-containing protein [Planctomycetota bacterium]